MHIASIFCLEECTSTIWFDQCFSLGPHCQWWIVGCLQSVSHGKLWWGLCQKTQYFSRGAGWVCNWIIQKEPGCRGGECCQVRMIVIFFLGCRNSVIHLIMDVHHFKCSCIFKHINIILWRNVQTLSFQPRSCGNMMVDMLYVLWNCT